MLAFSSASSKTAIIALVISILRNDWSIGVVAVIILSVGNAALMLLANIIKRTSEI
jgi:multicomponent Na+:H+ antiporter subunit F